MLSRTRCFLRTGVILDIDGVFIRGKERIEGSGAALKRLDDSKTPWVMLTNGSGSEEKKALEVSRIIGYDVDPHKVIVSHTPMKNLPLRDSRILLSGQKGGAEALSAYGYQNAVWSVDHMNAYPKQTPLKWRNGLAPSTSPPVLAVPSSEPYSCVAVFGEPCDWYSELQVITDVLRTNPKTGELCKTQQIPFYFFNDDITFAGDYPHPRLAGGALLLCLKSLFTSLTGTQLRVHRYGKPHSVQYEYAEQLLRAQAQDIDSIMCVGDNVLSDVAGANGAGPDFTSVLVLSGIAEQQPKYGEVPAACLPEITYNNVSDFVDDLLTEKKSAGDITLEVITGDGCPLCEELLDMLDDMDMKLNVDTVKLASLDAATQDTHKERIPVLNLKRPSGTSELAHGKVTEGALRWKLNKYC
eukprot:TRINITY_DN30194_c0_g1_i1.p1 TRINITY_DN30194_c0_g1~~TRINITY_DN30194_c0_g1_i1.p1  ORF type:complete len:412 (+),score=119.50 TRINITY_DN30194_c0_g1_i1:36-1271(+)